MFGFSEKNINKRQSSLNDYLKDNIASCNDASRSVEIMTEDDIVHEFFETCNIISNVLLARYSGTRFYFN